MNQQPPGSDEFDDVDDFYRRASALDSSRPSEAVRRDVLAHAARLADERASSRGSHKGAASRFGWRPAVFGTLAAAALAGLMVVPRFLAPLGPAPVAAPSPTVPAQIPAPSLTAPTGPAPSPISTPAAKAASGPPAALLSTSAAQPTPSAEPSSPLARRERDTTSGPADVPVPAPAAAPPQERTPSQSGDLAQSPARDLARSPEPAGGRGAAMSPVDVARSQPPLPLPGLARSQQAPSSLGGNVAAAAASGLAASAASVPSASAEGVATRTDKPATLAEVTVSGARRTAQDDGLAEVVVVGPSPSEVRSAAENGDLPALRRLLDMPVNLDSRDSLGRTALMLATLRGHAGAVDLLLEHGADPNVADDHGVTPLQVAKNEKKAAIATALRRRGAR